MKKTKIICTMGPNSDDREVMKQLVLNGMDVARFNFSHGNHEEHKKRYLQLRQVAEETGIPVAALLDTKGPEIRTGILKDGKKITKEMALEAFQKHPRIRVVSIDEGFKGNASLFKYARDLGNRRGDMYEIGLWEDSIVESGNDVMYAINIPQESVTIPETIDAIRASMRLQLTREEGTAKTNQYLGIGKFKK